MEQYLYTVNEEVLDSLPIETKQEIIQALESGKVIYMPAYSFIVLPQEQTIFTEQVLNGRHKNVSYDPGYQKLGAAGQQTSPDRQLNLQCVLQRFSEYAQTLLAQVFPDYQEKVSLGRTSYRPAEIKGRRSSKRKDDTRLHVDSFASTPVNGERILRVFCNINPYGEPRVWNLGEDFTALIPRFNHCIPVFNPLKAKLLKYIKVTKSVRSAYDHYMLNLHDSMKCDDQYQNTVAKCRVDFPSQSTWIVFTDQVSHAALSGQYLLEQTFYLPISSMQQPCQSPFHHWSLVRKMGA